MFLTQQKKLKGENPLRVFINTMSPSNKQNMGSKEGYQWKECPHNHKDTSTWSRTSGSLYSLTGRLPTDRITLDSSWL